VLQDILASSVKQQAPCGVGSCCWWHTSVRLKLI